jgi:hypothetical protein
MATRGKYRSRAARRAPHDPSRLPAFTRAAPSPSLPRHSPRAGARDPTRRRPFPLPPFTFPAIFESTVRTSATSIASPRRLPPRPPRSPRTPSGLRSHLPSPATPRAGARDPRRRQLFPPPNRSPHLGPTPTRRAHLALLGRVGIPADYRAARQGRRGRVRGTGGRDGQEEDFGHDHGFDYDFGYDFGYDFSDGAGAGCCGACDDGPGRRRTNARGGGTSRRRRGRDEAAGGNG